MPRRRQLLSRGAGLLAARLSQLLSAPCAGRNHFIGGKLVPSSIDAYLVMEFADGGDLFGLRGQLAATEVRRQHPLHPFS